tara:strand:+ start:244 stop:372 length:129 start_codon:yes stop_codon:yes gene_type:complete
MVAVPVEMLVMVKTVDLVVVGQELAQQRQVVMDLIPQPLHPI